MSYKGIILRKIDACTIHLVPPAEREVVFNTVTGEHAWLDENGKMVTRKLKDNNVELINCVHKGTEIPTNKLGNNGDKYLKESPGNIIINEIITIRRPYIEYTKINNQWKKIYNYKILERYEEFREFNAEEEDTIIYYVEEPK